MRRDLYRGVITNEVWILGRLVATYAVDCHWWSVAHYVGGAIESVRRYRVGPPSVR